MNRFFRKFNWKGLLSAILAIGILVGAVAGISAIFNNDTKTISSGEFSVGALNSNGEFEKSDTALVTKTAFKCLGINIDQKFESDSTYDVYYYESDGDFLFCRTGLKGKYTEDYPGATHARVVIHPECPEGVDEDDWKIRFWEVGNYASDIKITVNRDQNQKTFSENLSENANWTTGAGFTYGVDGKTFTTVNTAPYDYVVLRGIQYDHYSIYVKVKGESNGTVAAVSLESVADGDSIFDKAEINVSEINDSYWVKLDFTVKDIVNSPNVAIKVPTGCETVIYGY